MISKKQSLKELLNAKEDIQLPIHPLAPDVARKKSDIFRIDSDEEDGGIVLCSRCEDNSLENSVDETESDPSPISIEEPVKIPVIIPNLKNLRKNNTIKEVIESVENNDDEQADSKEDEINETFEEDKVITNIKAIRKSEIERNETNNSTLNEPQRIGLVINNLDLDIINSKTPSMFNPLLDNLSVIENVENSYSTNCTKKSKLIDLTFRNLMVKVLHEDVEEKSGVTIITSENEVLAIDLNLLLTKIFEEKTDKLPKDIEIDLIQQYNGFITPESFFELLISHHFEYKGIIQIT
jgi:hypothetical protein